MTWKERYANSTDKARARAFWTVQKQFSQFSRLTQPSLLCVSMHASPGNQFVHPFHRALSLPTDGAHVLQAWTAVEPSAPRHVQSQHLACCLHRQLHRRHLVGGTRVDMFVMERHKTPENARGRSLCFVCTSRVQVAEQSNSFHPTQRNVL
jgi:hypothetical protein